MFNQHTQIVDCLRDTIRKSYWFFSPQTSLRRALAGWSLAQWSVIDFMVSVWGQNLALPLKKIPETVLLSDLTQNSEGNKVACHAMNHMYYIVDQTYSHRHGTKCAALVSMGYSVAWNVISSSGTCSWINIFLFFLPRHSPEPIAAMWHHQFVPPALPYLLIESSLQTASGCQS